MKTTIIAQEKNPFLDREEFSISIESDAAPTKEAIITDLGKKADLTIVRNIHSNFGSQTFVADVVVYDSEEAKEKNVVLPKKVRMKMEADRKAAIEEEKKRKEEEAKAAAEAAAEAEKATEEQTPAEETKTEESAPEEAETETTTEETKTEEESA